MCVFDDISTDTANIIIIIVVKILLTPPHHMSLSSITLADPLAAILCLYRINKLMAPQRVF